MRGWVYVITNQAIGSVKIGYTMKDPVLRARQLNNSGVPHPYVLAYDALVTDPKNVERQVHKKLLSRRDGKEWFKCSVQEAVAVIRETVGDRVLMQTRHTVNIHTWRDATGTEKNPADAASERSDSAAIQTGQKVRATGTFSGRCAHCNVPFSVTLTRSDETARCPHCYRETPISSFVESRLHL